RSQAMPYCYRNIDGDRDATHPHRHRRRHLSSAEGLAGICRNDRVEPLLAAYLSRCVGNGAFQNSRARAAALARRNFSWVTACCSRAARSAGSTEPWVGRTQAVGQRVIPLVRMNSAMTASPLTLALRSLLEFPSPPSPRAGANREITSPQP